MAKHSADLLALARRGAELRYQELRAELVALEKQFPDLVAGAPRRARGAVAAAPAAGPRRRPMSAAEKKAVSARMKKYWAARRKTKAADKGAEKK